jgi:hypothetical protein
MNRYEGERGIVRREEFIIQPAGAKGKLRFLIDERSN